MTTFPSQSGEDRDQRVMYNIVLDERDSVQAVDRCGIEKRIDKEQFKFKARHPMRGILLQELTGDTAAFDTP